MRKKPLRVAILLIASLQSCGPSGAKFVSRSPKRSAAELHLTLNPPGPLRIGMREGWMSSDTTLWILPRAVTHFWVGWSTDGEAASVLACTGPDSRTLIERIAPGDFLLQKDVKTPNFADSDRNLAASLRATFRVDASMNDRDMFFWYCNQGETAFRKRFWPAKSEPSMLPD